MCLFYLSSNICSFSTQNINFYIDFPYSIVKDQFSFRISSELVGLDGLEPSTSRLSGARSNHLSYRPFSYSFGFPFDHHVGFPTGGDEGNRTLDPLLAGQVLSQLSYTPIKGLLWLFQWSVTRVTQITDNWTTRSLCTRLPVMPLVNSPVGL